MKPIEDAWAKVDRKQFLPPNMRDHWAEDRPLPIGYGQTNSQPSTVRRMLEWLGAEKGMRVLDVGSGSGWTSALLAHIVGTDGQVHAVELVPELVVQGRENCNKLKKLNVSFHQAGKQLGLPEYAPYDRILVSASAASFPDDLLEQLATPGKLVVPVGNTIFEIAKDANGTVSRRAHPGFVFVPLL